MTTNPSIIAREGKDLKEMCIRDRFRITLPSIKNTLFVTLLLRVIWVANSVDIIQNMTAGGPAYATQTLGVYVYQTAHVLNLGYASAMAVMMLSLIHI